MQAKRMPRDGTLSVWVKGFLTLTLVGGCEPHAVVTSPASSINRPLSPVPFEYRVWTPEEARAYVASASMHTETGHGEIGGMKGGGARSIGIGQITGPTHDFVEPPAGFIGDGEPTGAYNVYASASATIINFTDATAAGGASKVGGGIAWTTGSGRLNYTINNGTPTAVPGSCGNFNSCQWVQSVSVDCINSSVYLSSINTARAYWTSFAIRTSDAAYASDACTAVTAPIGGSRPIGVSELGCVEWANFRSYDNGLSWEQVSGTWLVC